MPLLPKKNESLMKDQILIILADYRTCKVDGDAKSVEIEGVNRRVSEEIADRIVKNLPFVTKKVYPTGKLTKKAVEIADTLHEYAKMHGDPYGFCREEGKRIVAANEVIDILRS